MKAASLRWRLVLLAALAIAVALSVAGLSLVLIFERHMERRIEQELDIRLTELLSAFALDAGQPQLTRTLSDPRYDQPLSGAYWQISDAGKPIAQSRSLWDQTLAPRAPDDAEGRAFESFWPNDVTLYVLDRQISLDNDGNPRAFRVAVALDHAEVDGLRQSFMGDVIIALGVIGAVLLLGAWAQINLGLRPLTSLRRRLSAVRDGHNARLDGNFPLEVAPLAEEFNALLARQEQMLRRARERAGTLAHGLKTPLTILSGEARRLDTLGMGEAANTLRDQLGAMRTHIERELARARSHGSASPGGLHTDARLSTARLIDLVSRMPRGRALRFDNSLPPGLSLQIDPDDFGEIVGNLLDNARKYAAASARVSAELTDGRVTLVIDDDGPGIAPDQRERLAERGERASDDRDGSGLGLAIVGDLLADYGATLTIAERPGGGCRVSFSLPGTPGLQKPQSGSLTRPRKKLSATHPPAREETAVQVVK